MKRKDKNELIYYTIVVLKYVAILFFIFGCIYNYKGMSILYNANNYMTGELSVDSYHSGPIFSGPESTVRVKGKIKDSISSGMLIGKDESAYVDSLITRTHNGLVVLIPVWYKQDGKNTLNRFEHEENFPVWRIIWKVLILFTTFNAPFVLFIILQKSLKKKFNIKE